MSWLPTMRIARMAWRGRQDPAGLLKSQLSGEQSPATAVQATAPGQLVAGPTAAPTIARPAPPPAHPAVVQPAAVAARMEIDSVHTHLLLLLR